MGYKCSSTRRDYWALSLSPSASPIVPYNSSVSVCVCVGLSVSVSHTHTHTAEPIKMRSPLALSLPHLPPFLPPTNGAGKKRRKLMNRRSLRSQMEYGFLFARNLRNTIVPNQNSMCSPTMVPALSSAASIGLVFETWSVPHKDLALLDVTTASPRFGVCVCVCVRACMCARAQRERERERKHN